MAMHSETEAIVGVEICKQFGKLPSAFKVYEIEDAHPVGFNTTLINEYDENVLRSVLHGALTLDSSVKAYRSFKLPPLVVWTHMEVFQKKLLVLYFPTKLPLIRDVAQDINVGFGY